MLESHSPDSFNYTAYTNDKTVRWYAQRSGLTEAERVILDRVKGEITDKRLLDIGVGGGRTTASLLEISRDYTAIDYSPAMVRMTKRRYGIDSIYCCDARNMNRFATDTFDFALFSFNGLDCLSHEDRLIALREIYRVLKPGGIFVFSSHNRAGDAAKFPWQQKDRALSWSVIKRCIKVLIAMPRHWQMRRLEIRQAEYAILNDTALAFSALTYYIEVGAQKWQLDMSGFEQVVAFDEKGVIVDQDDSSPWIYYLARKGGNA
jgi:ubiquinone/menaquinone biosynthesis C-methylase UbiE